MLIKVLPDAPTTTAAYAHGYASAGWRSFPVKRLKKSPAYPQWQKDATTDGTLIDQYWPREPVRNLGLVTGEAFDVWDIEGPHLDRFLGYMRDGGYSLPETPVAVTGRDGRHIFTLPTGVNATRRLHLGGVHIGELKSRGGLVVAPPSEVEHDGKRTSYWWQWAPDRLQLAAAPPWLLTLLEPVRPRRFVVRATSIDDGEKRLDALVKTVREQEQGSRNAFLYWAARRALEEGLPEGIVGAYMTAAGLEIGLSGTEVERTLLSAVEANAAAVGGSDAAH